MSSLPDQSLYVDLAIPVAVDTLFTYSVPKELQSSVCVGVRVVAPLGRRKAVGVVVSTSKSKPTIPNIKSVQEILDTVPVLSPELLKLGQWISDYYMCPLGEVVKAILVQGITRRGKRIVRLSDRHLDSLSTIPEGKPRQAAILRELDDRGSIALDALKKLLGSRNIDSPLNELVHSGHVVIEERPPVRSYAPRSESVVEITEQEKQGWQEWLSGSGRSAARQAALIRDLLTSTESSIPVIDLLKRTGASLSSVRSLVRKGLLSVKRRPVSRSFEYDLYKSSLGATNISLNTRQSAAVAHIGGVIHTGTFETILLHGVTGSGKTQVYIESIRVVLDQGKTAIVLIPEISLTAQIVRRLKYHFGDRVIALHSRMSPAERYHAWMLTREGTYSVVIGPRSAVFAPLKNLGLIVVDEEHDPSYKQYDQSPRYSARDVAIMRGLICGCPVVLGSATPSFESFTNARDGKYTLIELPERIDAAKLPAITVVDMTAERKRKMGAFRERRKSEADNGADRRQNFELGTISDLLSEKIADRLRKKEGVILLQNRRGFAPFVECPDCGHVEVCENCNISLTFHRSTKHLRCHYCGTVRQPPETCPECLSVEIRYRGVGTQRVEEELNKLFPSASIIRMDLDTTTRRGAHDSILRKFSDGDIDILLGTQMVAKGLDFARVTLVGVISADTQMLLPDFRSAERTFQLLTQVAGRAGRSTLAGEVIIQTYQPRHDALRHVVLHDYHSFYEEEIPSRRELGYPPFTRLVLVELRGKQEHMVREGARLLASLLRTQSRSMTILGPAAAALSRLKGFYRWHLVVKCVKAADPRGQILRRTLRSAINEYQRRSPGGNRSVRLIIDVDPVGMM